MSRTVINSRGGRPRSTTNSDLGDSFTQLRTSSPQNVPHCDTLDKVIADLPTPNSGRRDAAVQTDELSCPNCSFRITLDRTRPASISMDPCTQETFEPTSQHKQSAGPLRPDSVMELISEYPTRRCTDIRYLIPKVVRNCEVRLVRLSEDFIASQTRRSPHPAAIVLYESSVENQTQNPSESACEKRAEEAVTLNAENVRTGKEDDPTLVQNGDLPNSDERADTKKQAKHAESRKRAHRETSEDEKQKANPEPTKSKKKKKRLLSEPDESQTEAEDVTTQSTDKDKNSERTEKKQTSGTVTVTDGKNVAEHTESNDHSREKTTEKRKEKKKERRNSEEECSDKKKSDKTKDKEKKKDILEKTKHDKNDKSSKEKSKESSKEKHKKSEKQSSSNTEAADTPELREVPKEERKESKKPEKFSMKSYKIPKVKPGTVKRHPQAVSQITITENSVALGPNSVGLPPLLMSDEAESSSARTENAASSSPTLTLPAKPALTSFVGNRKRKSLTFSDKNTVHEFYGASSEESSIPAASEQHAEPTTTENQSIQNSPNNVKEVEAEGSSLSDENDDNDYCLTIGDKEDYIIDEEEASTSNGSSGTVGVEQQSADVSDSNREDSVDELLNGLERHFSEDSSFSESEATARESQSTEARVQENDIPDLVTLAPQRVCPTELSEGVCLEDECVHNHADKPLDLLTMLKEEENTETCRILLNNIKNRKFAIIEDLSPQDHELLLQAACEALLQRNGDFVRALEMILDLLLDPSYSHLHFSPLFSKLFERMPPTTLRATISEKIHRLLHNLKLDKANTLDAKSWRRMLRPLIDAENTEGLSYGLHLALNHCEGFEPNDYEVKMVVRFYCTDIRNFVENKDKTAEKACAGLVKLVDRLPVASLASLQDPEMRELENVALNFMDNRQRSKLEEKLFTAGIRFHTASPGGSDPVGNRFPWPGHREVSSHPSIPSYVSPPNAFGQPREFGFTRQLLSPVNRLPSPFTREPQSQILVGSPPSSQIVLRGPQTPNLQADHDPGSLPGSITETDVPFLERLARQFLQSNITGLEQFTTYFAQLYLRTGTFKGLYKFFVILKEILAPRTESQKDFASLLKAPHYEALRDALILIVPELLKSDRDEDIYFLTFILNEYNLFEWKNSQCSIRPGLYLQAAESCIRYEPDPEIAYVWLIRFRTETDVGSRTQELLDLEARIAQDAMSRDSSSDNYKRYMDLLDLEIPEKEVGNSGMLRSLNKAPFHHGRKNQQGRRGGFARRGMVHSGLWKPNP